MRRTSPQLVIPLEDIYHEAAAGRYIPGTAAEDRTKEGIDQHSGLFRSLVGDHGGLFWIHLISPH